MLEDLTKVRLVVADPHTNLTPSSRSSDLEDWSMVRDELLDLRQLHDLHTLDCRFHVSPLVVRPSAMLMAMPEDTECWTSPRTTSIGQTLIGC